MVVRLLTVTATPACKAVPRGVSLEFGLWGERLDLSCCALVPLRATSALSRVDGSYAVAFDLSLGSCRYPFTFLHGSYLSGRPRPCPSPPPTPFRGVRVVGFEWAAIARPTMCLRPTPLRPARHDAPVGGCRAGRGCRAWVWSLRFRVVGLACRCWPLAVVLPHAT